VFTNKKIINVHYPINKSFRIYFPIEGRDINFNFPSYVIINIIWLSLLVFMIYWCLSWLFHYLWLGSSLRKDSVRPVHTKSVQNQPAQREPLVYRRRRLPPPLLGSPNGAGPTMPIDWKFKRSGETRVGRENILGNLLY